MGGNFYAMIYQWVGILSYDISMGGDFKLCYIKGGDFKIWYINEWGLLSYDISMGGDFWSYDISMGGD